MLFGDVGGMKFNFIFVKLVILVVVILLFCYVFVEIGGFVREC